MPEIEVHPTTPDRWDDVVDLFERRGPRGGTPQTNGCWCQFWHLRGKTYWDGHGAGNRKRLETEIRTSSEPGLLAYVDGVPVGWCRLGPRERFERLEHSPKLAHVDDAPVWSVICFYVHPSVKRNGIASILRGCDRACGRTWSPDSRGLRSPGRTYDIDAYTGYLPMFLAAGFEPVRASGRRTIVRLELV